jgi:hypothetical protein
MAQRKGRGKVIPRKFGANRVSAQVSGNTQKLKGNTQ